jgi:hypothetical protein
LAAESTNSAIAVAFIADVFVVYSERKKLPVKVSAFVDFLSEWFGSKSGIAH